MGNFFLEKKTDIIDLKIKLDSSENECNKLRSSLSKRDKEVEEMKRQIAILMAKQEQREQLQALERSPNDIHFVRKFKQKLQFLQQLEMTLSERMARQANANVALPQTIIDVDAHHAEVPTPSSTIPIALQASPIHVENNDQDSHDEPKSEFLIPSDENDHLSEGNRRSSPKKPTIDVGAYYLYDPNCKQGEIYPPFREKIDFSKIQLRQLRPPPNHVERARDEYFEAQRQFQQQQEQVTNHHLHHTFSSHDSYLYGGSPCMPEFTEKIDLKNHISKLRKTPRRPSIIASEDATTEKEEYSDKQLEESGHDSDITMYASPVPEAHLGQYASPCGSPMSDAMLEQFLGGSDISDFLSIPTPTAMIWRAELDRKNMQS